MLIHELDAIAAMKQVETSDTVLKSLQKSGENTVAGLTSLAMADCLGKISFSLATSMVPGVGGLVLSTSGTARLNETINITSPPELWLRNKNKLPARPWRARIARGCRVSSRGASVRKISPRPWSRGRKTSRSSSVL